MNVSLRPMSIMDIRWLATLPLAAVLIVALPTEQSDATAAADPTPSVSLAQPADGTYIVKMVDKAGMRKAIKEARKLRKAPPATQLRAPVRVVCNGRVGNPHWSSGARSVIFKDQVVCTGTGVSSVNVSFSGSLAFGKGGSAGKPIFGPLQTLRTCNNQVQTFIVNNPDRVPFYCPPIGKNSIKKTGTYRAFGKISMGSSSDSGGSPNVFVKANP